MTPASVTPARVTPASVAPALVTSALRTPADYLRAGRVESNLPLDPASVAVFARAFIGVVRRRFRPGCAVAEITRSVIAAGAHLPLPALDTEMLVRAALGEAVPVADMPDETVVATYVLMFAALTDELALTDAEVAELVLAGQPPHQPEPAPRRS